MPYGVSRLDCNSRQADVSHVKLLQSFRYTRGWLLLEDRAIFEQISIRNLRMSGVVRTGRNMKARVSVGYSGQDACMRSRFVRLRGRDGMDPNRYQGARLSLFASVVGRRR